MVSTPRPDLGAAWVRPKQLCPENYHGGGRGAALALSPPQSTACLASCFPVGDNLPSSKKRYNCTLVTIPGGLEAEAHKSATAHALATHTQTHTDLLAVVDGVRLWYGTWQNRCVQHRVQQRLCLCQPLWEVVESLVGNAEAMA